MCCCPEAPCTLEADASSAICNAEPTESSILRSEPSLAVGSAELKGLSRPPQLSTLGTRCASLL